MGGPSQDQKGEKKSVVDDHCETVRSGQEPKLYAKTFALEGASTGQTETLGSQDDYHGQEETSGGSDNG